MLITAVVGLVCNIINIFTLHNFGGGGNNNSEEESEETGKDLESKQSHCHSAHIDSIVQTKK
jgi:hypothetical protein